MGFALGFAIKALVVGYLFVVVVSFLTGLRGHRKVKGPKKSG
ncbi:MAG TPA: hypothetical protein VM598_05850 [Bdellovibrionota bacterium]|nr:hypothetical protein [Bdellovibrionota bacterium]